MDKETGTMHKSISAERRMIRLNLCIPYLEVESSEKEFAFQAKKFSERNYRKQVYLIDIKSRPDVESKWIFLYLDYITTFVLLLTLS